MKIGVVDSGIGGITTLRELMQQVNADYFYYMDNANIPYGDKSMDELLSIARHIMDTFVRVGVDIVVIACNTLSAMCGDALRCEYSMPIVCIEPSIRPAHETGLRTLVLATHNTIHSRKFGRLRSIYSDAIYKSSDMLAQLIEKGDMDNAIIEVNQKLAGENIENIVLGCTHYVYLKPYLEERGYSVFEGNSGVANRVAYLTNNINIKCQDTTHVFLHSDRIFNVDFVTKYMKTSWHFW